MSRALTSSDVVYLDYNATAPLRPEARDAVVDAMLTVGNASSVHGLGRDAAARVSTAREQVAGLVGCSPGEIVFTSGATEANNLALGAAGAAGGVIVTSAVEHPAVLETAKALTSGEPGRLVLLGVDAEGVVDLEALRGALDGGGVSVVSLMAANNETGVVSDLNPVVEMAHAAGALVHTDATQVVGRLPCDVVDWGVDLLSMSAHKFGGPQGVGALFIRRGLGLAHRPLLVGGGQERGWRAGTLNVAGIAGMGAAAATVVHTLGEESSRCAALRDSLETGLSERLDDVQFNGARTRRLPGVSSVTFRGAPADAVLAGMPHIAASDGSACASGAPTPSHVLLAMGRSRDDAAATVRYSLGYATTRSEIDQAIDATTQAVSHVRRVLAAAP